MKHGWTRRLLVLLTAITMLLCLLPSAAAADSGFPDMPAKEHWAYEALSSAVEHGLLQGADGKLMPEGVLSRAQMATVVNRAFGAADKADISGFSDVLTGAWYYEDIAKAVRMGTLQGMGNGKMSPETSITREQAFTVLARAFRLENGTADALKGFPDAAQVSSYAVGPLAAMVKAGYVNGSDGKLRPGASITRQEFAQVLYNMLRNYITEAGTYSENLTGNVIVNVPGVVLKDAKISGDLIIGEGVGNGDVTLDNVQLSGRMVVRGGGEHSIIIRNKTSVGNVIVNKTGDGGVRLRTEDGCRVEVVQIDDGKDDVILNGEFNQVKVTTDAPVVLKDAVVAEMTVTGENAAVSTQGTTEIAAVKIEESAAGAALTVSEETKIAVVETAAEKVSIGGSGAVDQVTVSGNDTAVNVPGASVTATENTSGVTAGNEEVKPDTTVVAPSTGSDTPSTPTPTPIPTPTPTTGTSVSTVAELKSALANSSIQAIDITSDLVIDEFILVEGSRTVTIAAGKTVTVNAGVLFTGSGAKLVNNGTLVSKIEGLEEKVDPETNETYLDLKLYPLDNGQYATAELVFASGASLVNNGTVNSYGGLSIIGASVTNAQGAVMNIFDYETPDFQEYGCMVVQGSTFVNDGTLNDKCFVHISAWHEALASTDPEDNPVYGLPSENNVPSTFTNNGVINNTNSLWVSSLGSRRADGDVILSKLVNNGTINNAVDSGFYVYTNLENNGTIVNNSHFEVSSVGWTYGMLEDGTPNTEQPFDCVLNNAGTITSNGSFEVLRRATLTNTGTITNNDWFLVTGILNHRGGKFENSGSFHLENFRNDTTYGKLDLTGAPNGSFINDGFMKVEDQYDADYKFENGQVIETADLICTVIDPNRVFNPRGENPVVYSAVVFSKDGFTRANDAQTEKTNNNDGYLGCYDELEIRADLTVDSTVSLDAFQDYWVTCQWSWDAEKQEDVPNPATLTVAANGSLTIPQEHTLHLDEYGKLAVQGTLTTKAEQPDDPETPEYDFIAPGTVEVSPSGSFDGTGGTFTNNGEFIVRYEEDRDGTGSYAREGTVTGAPTNNAYHIVSVHSADAFMTAATDNSILKVEIQGGETIELTQNVTLENDLYIHGGTSLVIPYGKTLTLAAGNNIGSDGNIYVEGNLVIEAEASLDNNGNINVGAVTGSEKGVITVNGFLMNRNYLKVFGTGSIALGSSGVVDGEPLVGSDGKETKLTCDLTDLNAKGDGDGGFTYYRNVRFTQPLTITASGDANTDDWRGINFDNCEFAGDVTVQTDGSRLQVFMPGCTFAEGKGTVTDAAVGANVDMYGGNAVQLYVPDGTRVQANVCTDVTLETNGSFTLNGVTVTGKVEGEGENRCAAGAGIYLVCDTEHPEGFNGDHSTCENAQVFARMDFGNLVSGINFNDDSVKTFAENPIGALQLCYWDNKEAEATMNVKVNRDGTLHVESFGPGCKLTVTGTVTKGTLNLNYNPGEEGCELINQVTATDPSVIVGNWTGKPENAPQNP